MFSSIQGCLPGLTWGKNEHCQPLVALRPLDADKPFIFPPREARKTTLNTGKRFPHLENVKRIEQSTIVNRPDSNLMIFLSLANGSPIRGSKSEFEQRKGERFLKSKD